MIRSLRRAFALALVALCVPLAAFAAPPGFAFLEIPSGARAAALGGAFASMATGIEAQFWNPAGLASLGTFQVEGTHTELIAGLRHDTFSAGGRVAGGGLAASFRALYTEPIDERDDLGNLIGSFGSHDLELGVAYGWAMATGLEVGLSGQVIRERIANLAATTYGFGAGAAWQPAGLEGLRIGGALQNLGPSAHYTIDGVEGEPVGLPMAVQGGGTYSMDTGERIELQGAVEGRFTRGRAGQGMAGLEIRDASGASLRGGWRFNDDATTYSLGAGYAMPGLRLDYAYVPLRLDLGDTHRFGFTAQF
jgi:Uncharacterised protein family (UPF0164)